MNAQNLENNLKASIRAIQDFPKAGIVFRDITPVLQDPTLRHDIVEHLYQRFSKNNVDVIVGVEARGFLFGMLLAQRMQVPFVPIRKQGKLPYEALSQSYELEYGTAVIEMHKDALQAGARVLIHDDLLATGGTVRASSQLIQRLGGEIVGYSFLVELDFLQGREALREFGAPIVSLANYPQP